MDKKFLQQMVADGVVTQAQADAMALRLAQGAIAPKVPTTPWWYSHLITAVAALGAIAIAIGVWLFLNRSFDASSRFLVLSILGTGAACTLGIGIVLLRSNRKRNQLPGEFLTMLGALLAGVCFLWSLQGQISSQLQLRWHLLGWFMVALPVWAITHLYPLALLLIGLSYILLLDLVSGLPIATCMLYSAAWSMILVVTGSLLQGYAHARYAFSGFLIRFIALIVLYDQVFERLFFSHGELLTGLPLYLLALGVVLFGIWKYVPATGLMSIFAEVLLLGGAMLGTYNKQITIAYLLCAAAIGLGFISSLQEHAFKRMVLYLVPSFVYIALLWQQFFGFHYLSLLILGLLLMVLALALQRLWRREKMSGDLQNS